MAGVPLRRTRMIAALERAYDEASAEAVAARLQPHPFN